MPQGNLGFANSNKNIQTIILMSFRSAITIPIN
jgi:hypothetical protein